MTTIKWDVFISHAQAQAGDTCALIAHKLTHEHQLDVWFDMDAQKLNTDGMMDGVLRSDNFLLFVTSGVFERPFCCLEISEAIKAKKNVIVVYQADPRFGGKPIADLLAEVPAEFDSIKSSEWIQYHRRKDLNKATIAMIIEQFVRTYIKLVPRMFVPREKFADYAPGTRSWIFDAVDAWHANPSRDTNVMVLLGGAGVGKSVFSAELCRRGSKELRDNKPLEEGAIPILGYHFFKHDDAGLNNSRGCVLSICEQLKLTLPGFQDEFMRLGLGAETMQNLSPLTLFDRIVVAPAACVATQYNKRGVIVLDALDECEDPMAIVDILEKRWSGSMPEWLGLFVTSRPEQTIPERLHEFKHGFLNSDDTGNEDDIKSYIRAKLGPLIPAKQLERAVALVFERSEGLFLYARFIDDLIAQHGPEKGQISLAALERFPHGKHGIFADYFQRLYERLDKNRDRYRDLLFPILATRSPVPKFTLMDAIGLVPLDDEDELDEAAPDLFLETYDHCLSLLAWQPGFSGTVRFIHKSMVDWLTGKDKSSKSAYTTGHKDLHVPLEDKNGKQQVALARVLLDRFTHPVPPEVGLDDDVLDTVNPFVVRQCFFHLCKARMFDEAKPLLLGFDNIMTRLVHDSSTNIWMDAVRYILTGSKRALDKRGQVEEMSLVVRLLRLCTDALNLDHRTFAQQVLRRTKPSQTEIADLRQASLAYLAKHKYWNNTTTNTYGTDLVGVEGCLLQSFSMEMGVNAIAISPDGATAYIASRLLVHCYDTVTWLPKLKPLAGHEALVGAIAVSPDGRFVVTGSWDYTFAAWDTRTCERLFTHRHPGTVQCVAVSPDSQTIVSCSDKENVVRVWSQDGQLQRQLQGHTESAYHVKFSPDGQTLVSTSHDASARLWDTTSWEPRMAPLVGHESVVKCAAFSPDGSTIATCCATDEVRVWDVGTGALKLDFKQFVHGSAWGFNSITFSPDGTTLATSGVDGTVRLWDAATGNPVNRLGNGHDASATTVVFLGDGRTLLSGSLDSSVCVWDTSRPQDRPKSNFALQNNSHTKGVAKIVYSRDGRHVASVSKDTTVRLWDARTGTSKKLGSHQFAGKFLAFSPDSKYLVSSSLLKDIVLWDVKTGTCKHELAGPTDAMAWLGFSADSKTVLCGGKHNFIRMWDVASGEGRTNVGLVGGWSLVSAVSVSEDGKLVAAGSEACPNVQVTEVATGEITAVLSGHEEPVVSVTFAPNGQVVASGSEDQTVRVWDLSGDHTTSMVLRGHHTCAVVSLQFSGSDGNTLTSRDEAGVAVHWNVQSGECLGVDESGLRKSPAILGRCIVKSVDDDGDRIPFVYDNGFFFDEEKCKEYSVAGVSGEPGSGRSSLKSEMTSMVSSLGGKLGLWRGGPAKRKSVAAGLLDGKRIVIANDNGWMEVLCPMGG